MRFWGIVRPEHSGRKLEDAFKHPLNVRGSNDCCLSPKFRPSRISRGQLHGSPPVYPEQRKSGKRGAQKTRFQIRPCRAGLAAYNLQSIYHRSCGCSSVGRASRCQRDCRGFESHQPLSCIMILGPKKRGMSLADSAGVSGQTARFSGIIGQMIHLGGS